MSDEKRFKNIHLEPPIDTVFSPRSLSFVVNNLPFFSKLCKNMKKADFA